ncbi:MAG: hypothetical protein J6Y19_10295, partial [Kiritimatiellae bacterium]|nr:hypothetical protein [Kiritimatiellia bacterium]
DPFGRQVLLRDGETYATILDPYACKNPSLYILDARGRYVGRLAHQIIASQADMLSLHAAMGDAAHLEAIALAPYRARHEDREGEVAAARRHNERILSLRDSPFRRPSRPTPKVDALETLDAIDAGGVALAEPVAVSDATASLDDIFGTL